MEDDQGWFLESGCVGPHVGPEGLSIKLYLRFQVWPLLVYVI